MSKRESLLLSIVTALNALGKPAGLAIHRSRTRPLTQDALPACVVYVLSEQASRGDGPHGYKARRALLVRVECRVAVIGADVTPPDAALDALTSWTVKAMMADPSWGGLAHNTQEVSTTWDAEETDAVYAAAAVDFSLDYITAAGDPDAP
jgi:hypothetical protein